jgi:hypothetical protein
MKTEIQSGPFSASLRIKDAGPHHQEILSVTGLRPSDSHLRGEPRLPAIKRMPTWTSDLWALDSPLSENSDLSEHLKWLWKKLFSHKEYFKALTAQGIYMDIFCGYSPESRSTRFSVQPEALRLAYEFEISLQISVVL